MRREVGRFRGVMEAVNSSYSEKGELPGEDWNVDKENGNDLNTALQHRKPTWTYQ